MLLDARVRERLLESADTELERRLGSLLEGEGGWLGDEGDRAAAGGEEEVGVLLLDTGDQGSG